jgi:hypothetical protein
MAGIEKAKEDTVRLITLVLGYKVSEISSQGLLMIVKHKGESIAEHDILEMRRQFWKVLEILMRVLRPTFIGVCDQKFRGALPEHMEEGTNLPQ